MESRKDDAIPMLASGSQKIGHWQIDQFFLQPFVGGIVDSSRRLYLVNNLNRYLSELRKFGIYVEVWIDGSFTTKKPDPDDIDVVVFVYKEELDTIPTGRKPFFAKLTVMRELMKAQYDIDTYLGYLENAEEVAYWTNKFSKGHYTHSEKGFFKILIAHV